MHKNQLTQWTDQHFSSLQSHQYKTTKKPRNQLFLSHILHLVISTEHLTHSATGTMLHILHIFHLCHIVFYGQNLLDAFALQIAIATMKLPHTHTCTQPYTDVKLILLACVVILMKTWYLINILFLLWLQLLCSIHTYHAIYITVHHRYIE